MYLQNIIQILFQILDLLGPKTDADLVPPPKAEKKAKNTDSGKKPRAEDSKGIYCA